MGTTENGSGRDGGAEPTLAEATRRGRGLLRWSASGVGLAVLALLTLGLAPVFAEDDVPPLPDAFGGQGADPSVGASVPPSYFGPMPSEVDKNLVGPVQLLRSGTMSDDGLAITLPLYRGQLRSGEAVWYILTDTTDKENAEGLGLNFASKLAYANVGRAARTARLEPDTSLTFNRGRVDFAPERRLVPASGENAFPPATANPGSVGDEFYSPLVQITNQAGAPVYNAPMVAFNVGADRLQFCQGNADHRVVHDRVMAICADENGGGTVTIALTPIFSFAKPAVYMSTEASDPVVATLDMATFTPALGDIEGGRDDSAFSAIERLFVTANGPTGADNPQRQGLNSALRDGDGSLPPLHVVGGLPTVALDYSPLWDIQLGEWTQDAIRRGYRARVIDEFQYLGLVEEGWITGPGGAPYGSVGIIVNCPIVARFL